MEAEIRTIEHSLRVGSADEIGAALHVLQALGLKMEDPGQTLDALFPVMLAALQTVPIAAVRSAVNAIARGETDIVTFYPSIPKMVGLCRTFEMSDRHRLDRVKRELIQRRSLPPPPHTPEEEARRAAKVQATLDSLPGTGDLRPKRHWMDELPPPPTEPESAVKPSASLLRVLERQNAEHRRIEAERQRQQEDAA